MWRNCWSFLNMTGFLENLLLQIHYKYYGYLEIIIIKKMQITIVNINDVCHFFSAFLVAFSCPEGLIDGENLVIMREYLFAHYSLTDLALPVPELLEMFGETSESSSLSRLNSLQLSICCPTLLLAN